MSGHLRLDAPWLEFDLGAEMQVLSWTLLHPGFVRARRILWREVRNADLSEEFDVAPWLQGELASRGAADAVTFLTSRDIRFFDEAHVQLGDCAVQAVATVGLSNAERVGCRLERVWQDWGTINIAVRVTQGLSEAAFLEVMSIAVEARTAAIMDAGLDLSVGRATGTGTDCVAIAAPSGETVFAGLHTELGEAVGQAVYTAVARGASVWMRSIGAQLAARN
nr:adenosylcobinamide amidohydrolase [uncultured Celeribacter sp.]